MAFCLPLDISYCPSNIEVISVNHIVAWVKGLALPPLSIELAISDIQKILIQNHASKKKLNISFVHRLFAKIHKDQVSQLELLRHTKRAMDKTIASSKDSSDSAAASLASLVKK